MVEKPNFRRPPSAPPPTPAPNVSSLAPNQLFRPGEVYISDVNLKTLQQFGYKQGDPIPQGLGRKIQEIQQQITAEIKHESASVVKRPPVVPDKVIDIKDMQPDQVAEVQALLQQARQEGMLQDALKAREASIQSQLPTNAHPSVVAAVRQGLEQQQPGVPDGNMINYAKQLQQVAEQPTLTLIDDTLEAQDATAAAPVKPAPAAPAPAADAAPPSAGGLEPLTHCPRCRFDLSHAFTVEPTERDKMVFLTGFWNGDRFDKDVELLGGKLIVRFRSLTSKEATMALTQVRMDTKTGKVADSAEWYMALMDYRLAMSIAQIRDQSGAVISEVPPIDEIEYEGPADGHPETPLVPLQEFVLSKVLSQESLRRVVGQHHRQFQRLVEALEAMSSEPDFWKGIEPQH